MQAGYREREILPFTWCLYVFHVCRIRIIIGNAVYCLFGWSPHHRKRKGDTLNLNTMRLVLLKSNSVNPGLSTRSFANLVLFDMRGGYWEGTNSSNCDREVTFWLRRNFVPSTAQLHKELGMFRHGAFHLPDFVDFLDFCTWPHRLCSSMYLFLVCFDLI